VQANYHPEVLRTRVATSRRCIHASAWKDAGVQHTSERESWMHFTQGELILSEPACTVEYLGRFVYTTDDNGNRRAVRSVSGGMGVSSTFQPRGRQEGTSLLHVPALSVPCVQIRPTNNAGAYYYYYEPQYSDTVRPGGDMYTVCMHVHNHQPGNNHCFSRHRLCQIDRKGIHQSVDGQGIK
jgi:hypothetical protein